MIGPNASTDLHDKKLGEQHVELRSLFETSKIINSSLELSTILNNLLLTPMGRMMLSRGLVMIARDDDTFSIEAQKGLDPSLLGMQFPIQFTFTNTVLVSETTFAECKLKDFFLEQKIELLLPIRISNRLLGLIAFGKKINNSDFNINELDFLSSLSNIASTAIENASIFQKLKRVNKRLDKKIQELNTLFEIGKELNSTLDVKKITNLLIYAIMGEMFATRCFVFLKNGPGLELSEFRGAGKSEQDIDAFTNVDFLNALADIKKPMLVDETLLPNSLAPVKSHRIKVAIPMRNQDVTQGILLLGEKINKLDYDKDDLDFLSTLCNQAMISLENARLFDETLEKERMEEELNIAREIQQRLLPESYPRFDCLDVKGLNIPSRQVGGDYFDCIQLDENRVAIAIGDVSGKGVPASLLMSNLHAGLHSLIMSQTDIKTLVSRLNNLIQKNTNIDKFITFFYAELDLKAKTMTYCNAGHNPPYLVKSPDNLQELDVGGLLLGMMPNIEYQTATVPLDVGDLFFMFTDGVTEAMNESQEEFEEHRVMDALKKLKIDDSSIQEALDYVLDQVKIFANGEPQSDDLTMLGFKLNC